MAPAGAGPFEVIALEPALFVDELAVDAGAALEAVLRFVGRGGVVAEDCVLMVFGVVGVVAEALEPPERHDLE